MKKTCILLIILIVSYSLLAQTQFYWEDCEEISDWTITNGPNNTAAITWNNDNVGNRNLNGSINRFLSCDSDFAPQNARVQSTITSGVIDCSLYSNVELRFTHYYLQYGSQIGRVYVISDGVSHLVKTYNVISTNGEVASIDISTFADQKTIQIAFEFDDNNQWTWYWLIDNIQLIGMSADDYATNPNPANNQINLHLNGMISWDFGSNTETYDLWFGPGGNMAEVISGGVAGTTGMYHYSNLAELSSYQWQVISYSAGLSYPGIIWTFNTSAEDGLLLSIGDGNLNWRYPFFNHWMDMRLQSIYLAEEFGAGYEIKSIALNVSTLPGQSLEHFYVRMKETENNSFSSTHFDNENLTTVLYLTDYTLSETGWTNFELDTSFYFSGVRNLLIDIVYDNSSYSTGGYTKAYGTNLVRSITTFGDIEAGNVLDATTASHSWTQLNNMRFIVKDYTPILGNLEGYVSAETHGFVQGVTVSCRTSSAISDENGYYFIEGIVEGSHTVFAENMDTTPPRLIMFPS
jgi:hypothetical protein